MCPFSFSSVYKCPLFGPFSHPVKWRRLATVACTDTKTPCLSPTHLMSVWACSLLLLPLSGVLAVTALP